MDSTPQTPVSTPLKMRLSAAAAEPLHAHHPLYVHTSFCQIFLPAHDPGNEVRKWDHKNGKVAVTLTAGEVWDQEKQCRLPLGMPWGTKARILMMVINQQAMTTKSPTIETGKNLLDFCRRKMRLGKCGRNTDALKEQLARLAALHVQITTPYINDKGRNCCSTIQGNLILRLEEWFEVSDGRTVKWPKEIQLSLDYYQDLRKHGVPLNEHHIHVLSHSPMALDIYAWLAQRLHRAKPEGDPISWQALQGQFGRNYADLDRFRQAWRLALNEVLMVYKVRKSIVEDKRGARKSYPNGPGLSIVREPALRGLTLYPAPPPVKPTWMRGKRFDFKIPS